MAKLKDEQKGFLFLILIVAVAVSLAIFFSINLRTDTVKDSVGNEEIVRTLFVVEDEDSSVLFSALFLYNPKFSKGAVVSIPGNTGAIYDTLGRVDRIDRVYEEAGIESFRDEVAKLLGVRIPFYIVFSYENFIKFSDFMGGLRVFIPSPVDYQSAEQTEEEIRSGNKGPLETRFLLPSGAVTLDGDKVSDYLHYKLPDENDSDVDDRNQNIMIALLEKLHDNKALILNGKNFREYSKFFTVNLDFSDSYTLFSLICEIDTESIIRQTITGSLRTVDGQELLLPSYNGAFIKDALKQTTGLLLSNDGTYTSRYYILEIQNGTNVQGLARRTANLYQNASYEVLSFINADRDDYEQTIIVDHINNEEAAKNVGDLINCDNIVTASEAYADAQHSQVDFTIILGSDFNGRYVTN